MLPYQTTSMNLRAAMKRFKRQDNAVNRFVASLRSDVFELSNSQFYTHWTSALLFVAMAASLFGYHTLLPAAIANAAAVAAIACMGYSLSPDFDIANRAHAARRRAGEFSCHVLPLILSFILLLYVLPRIPHPSLPVSMSIVIAFGTAYLLTPTRNGNVGRAKLKEVYGADYTVATVILPVTSFLLLSGMRGKK